MQKEKKKKRKGRSTKCSPQKKCKFIKSETAPNIEREKKCVHKNYVNCDGLELSLWRQNNIRALSMSTAIIT